MAACGLIIDRRLRPEFHGSGITTDAWLLGFGICVTRSD